MTNQLYSPSAQEKELSQKLNIPYPNQNPFLRHRLAMAHNISDELFKNKSAKSGKEIITSMQPETQITIYDDDEWWSDNWDPTSFGIKYNKDKSFFEQLNNLRKTVPRSAKAQYSRGLNENSEWTIQGYQFKNCYFVYGGIEAENVLYSVSPVKSKSSMELFISINCEFCYELFECNNCFKSYFLDNCDNCYNCLFGFDLKNCEDCFGCVNLRNKKYCFLNQQLSKEKYQEKISKIDLGSYKILTEYRKKFNKFIKEKSFRKNLNNKNIKNSSGNNLNECVNCHNCFGSNKIQNSYNIIYSTNVRDSMDVFGSLDVEKCVFVLGKNLYNVKFSHAIFDSSNSEYCDSCFNIENCFGCVGLRNKKFHILNKPYQEEEYYKLVQQIKSKMIKDKEYGKFLPYKYSIYPYNLTPANKFYPINEEEAQKIGADWYKYNNNIKNKSENKIPDNIKNVTDEIINQPITCIKSGRQFMITEQELWFYKKFNLPTPRIHPMERRYLQYAKLRAPNLIESTCSICNKNIKIQGIKNYTQTIKNVREECYHKILNKIYEY